MTRGEKTILLDAYSMTNDYLFLNSNMIKRSNLGSNLPNLKGLFLSTLFEAARGDLQIPIIQLQHNYQTSIFYLTYINQVNNFELFFSVKVIRFGEQLMLIPF